MEGYNERNTGIHIPHRTIHEILDADGEVQGITKGGRGGRVRRECSHVCAQVHRPLTPDDTYNATLLSSERRRTPL